jgi:hypothetical protein
MTPNRARRAIGVTIDGERVRIRPRVWMDPRRGGVSC